MNELLLSFSSDFAMQRFDRESEVYKMIQENKESRAAPRQSNTFKMLQEVLEADDLLDGLQIVVLQINFLQTEVKMCTSE